MGKTTGSQFMTGPTWEMSNVKAAAIVRSKDTIMLTIMPI